MESFIADAIYVDAPPERVFAALLDPATVEVWLEAESVEIEPSAGGRFFARRRDGSVVSGRLDRVLPGRALVIRDWFWERAGERRGPMSLSFTLDRQDPGVWLTARQEGLDQNPGWKPYAMAARKELVQITLLLKRHIEGI